MGLTVGKGILISKETPDKGARYTFINIKIDKRIGILMKNYLKKDDPNPYFFFSYMQNPFL